MFFSFFQTLFSQVQRDRKGQHRLYTAKVGEPLNQVNEMLVDDDLIAVRDELRALREEYKQASGSGGGGFNLFGKLKEAANEIGVEWKD